MKYTLVMGLEIHVELKTKLKMFCTCSADYFGKPRNTQTCPTCLGLPGSLPIINYEAIEMCKKIGRALNCTINEKLIFERKNYSYPDLPKGYQISQYRWPLSTKGFINVGGIIRINRVHQEEDTAKLFHVNGLEIDNNRAGVPLVEIVTEADFISSQQAIDYGKLIQALVRDLKVSDANMEKGQMRLEANVSLKGKNVDIYKIELKNINSFKFMGYAIEYEILRQSGLLDQGLQLTQETRAWDEKNKETYLLRVKENAHDYRYFID